MDIEYVITSGGRGGGFNNFFQGTASIKMREIDRSHVKETS